MIRGIVAIFSPGEPIQPCARPVPSGAPQILGDRLVDNLGLAIRLRMEGRAHPELDTDEFEDVAPNMASEHRIPIAHNGVWEPMQSDNGFEERLRHCGRRVGVTQGDEVSMLGELINHRQDDTLAVVTRQALNEVHGDVCLDLRRDLEWFEKASWVQCLYLVALARRTRAHELAHESTVMVKDEVVAEAL